MARVAARLALLDPDDEARFREVLRCHICGGGHRLVTSTALLESELDFLGMRSNPQRYASLGAGAVADLEGIDGGAGSELAGLDSLDAPDRTLVAAAVGASSSGPVTVISDDEEIVTSIRQASVIDEQTYAFVWSQHSVEFFFELYKCGALPHEVLVVVAECEELHLRERLQENQISSVRGERKLARVKQIVTAAALIEAKRRK